MREKVKKKRGKKNKPLSTRVQKVGEALPAPKEGGSRETEKKIRRRRWEGKKKTSGVKPGIV